MRVRGGGPHLVRAGRRCGEGACACAAGSGARGTCQGCFRLPQRSARPSSLGSPFTLPGVRAAHRACPSLHLAVRLPSHSGSSRILLSHLKEKKKKNFPLWKVSDLFRITQYVSGEEEKSCP